MMLANIFFYTSISLATLTVILLATLSPVPYKQHGNNAGNPSVAISLYIQQPRLDSSRTHQHHDSRPAAGALTFHRTVTEGPESSSRVVGKAQGFIIPVERFAHSAFNIIYLTFDTPEYSGSLSIQAKQLEHKERDELRVVGGTGSFAFARGLAVLAKQNQDLFGMIYQVKLQLTFPNQSQPIRL